jgi:hypothetical protein
LVRLNHNFIIVLAVLTSQGFEVVLKIFMKLGHQ